MLTFDDDQMKKNLKSLRNEDDEILTKRAAKIKGMRYIDLKDISISTDALSLIDEYDSRNGDIAAFKEVGDQIHVVVNSEKNPKSKATIKNLKDSGYEVVVYLGTDKSLEKAWTRYDDLRLTHATSGNSINISEEALKTIIHDVHDNNDVERLLKESIDSEHEKLTSRIMEIIMGSAIALGASDVHIEPQEELVRLRFRQDGILEDVAFFSFDLFKSLISRIKFLSHMKINVTKDGQDGRFSIDFDEMQIEIRVSLIPSTYGEGVVMRVLDPRGINVGLSDLGMEPLLYGVVTKEVSKPNGLILNTGPTGSGKTTTLYSLLKFIHSPEIKILTIEDPIEYHLEGVSQSQTNHEKGYDFNSGLRYAMRQDPDVILVGEIRDHETALAAMQASQTGHLVLSTLHTNSAAGAVPRLLDLEINHASLAQSLSLVLAQRLVRRLLPSRKKVKPTPEQERVLRTILKSAHANGKDLSRFDVSHDMEIFTYEPVPTEKSKTGYKGRVGIFEGIIIDHAIKNILDQKPTDRQVHAAAQGQNLLTLPEDGAIKILTGQTSYEEITRVMNLERDFGNHTETDKKEIKKTQETKVVAPAPSSIPNSILESVFENKEPQEKTPTSSYSEVFFQKESIGEPDLLSQIRSNLAHDELQKTHILEELPGPLNKKMRSAASQEVSMLTDYLKILENHQSEYPEAGVGEKIHEVENTILHLLKSHKQEELFLQRDNERRIQHEIDTLIHDLQKLRAHQSKHPDVGISSEIRDIRTTIESLQHK